jgi:hypothetical protein
LGLVEFVERRRNPKTGRFLSWIYRLVFTPMFSKKPKSTGHGRERGLYKYLNKQNFNTPQPPEAKEEKRAREAARRRQQMIEVFGPDAV